MAEDRLAQTLHQIYRATEAEIENVLQCIQVIHLHGRLPAVGPFDADWIARAADELRLIHDANIDGVHLKRALSAMQQARIVCFLGLGYHESNLDRLRVSNVVEPSNQAQEMFGSAYGLRDAKRAWLDERLGKRLKLGGQQQNALDLLRDFYVLRS